MTLEEEEEEEEEEEIVFAYTGSCKSFYLSLYPVITLYTVTVRPTICSRRQFQTLPFFSKIANKV